MSRSDYAHWHEDQDWMWWQEEGRFGSEPPPYCDECGFNHAGECPDDRGDEDEDDEDDYRPDEHLDMDMEDRLSGGGGDVDFD